MTTIARWWLLLAASGAALAQHGVTPPRPKGGRAEPAPAIVLLLREPRTLDVDRVRRRLLRLLDIPVGTAPAVHGTWLTVDGTGLVGGRSGVRFTVRATGPEMLPEAATCHLAAEERELLASHRARLVVGAEPGKDAAATRAAYRLLGGIAAALLLPDVLAVGAAEYGTFEVHDRDDSTLREDLLGDDPLLALAPMMTTSLLVYLREPRTFDEAALSKAAGVEFGVTFALRGRGASASNFVGVHEQMAMLCLGKQTVVLTVGEAQRPGTDELRAIEDSRVRQLLAEHRAVLELTTRGAPGEAEEAARARFVARTLAALWGDDVLGLAWHCDRTVFAAADEVPARLRAADPIAAVLGHSPVPKPANRGK